MYSLHLLTILLMWVFQFGTLTLSQNFQPNFVIFHIDDMYYTQSMSESFPQPIGALETNYLDIDTPNILKIRDEGFAFKRAYSGGAKCAPSRFSLLTGRYPSRSEYGAWRTTLSGSSYDPENGTLVSIEYSAMEYNDTIYNLPTYLRDYAGYSTGHIGKWHILSKANMDLYCADDYTESSYLTCVNQLKKSGWDYIDGLYIENVPEITPMLYDHNPEWITHSAIQFMNDSINNENNLHEPFFLNVAHTIPHTPDIQQSMFNYTTTQTPRGNLNYTPNSYTMRTRSEIWNQAVADFSSNSGNLDYAAGVIWLDDALGALYDWLDDNGILDKTVIIVLNDHGMNDKSTLYERGTRIFHYVRYPGLSNNIGDSYSNWIVSNIDIAPTLFELAGLNIENNITNTGYILDGKSWANNLNDNNLTDNRNRISEMFQSRTCISKNYKYIFRNTNERQSSVYHTWSREEFYDLNNDEKEQINQINNNSYSMQLQNLKNILNTHMQNTCPSTPLTDCYRPGYTNV